MKKSTIQLLFLLSFLGISQAVAMQKLGDIVSGLQETDELTYDYLQTVISTRGSYIFKDQVNQEIEKIMKEKDSKALDSLLIILGYDGIAEDYKDKLSALLKEEWHGLDEIISGMLIMLEKKSKNHLSNRVNNSMDIHYKDQPKADELII